MLYKNLEDLRSKVEEFKAQGRRIVLTSGTFDMLHIGHMLYLIAARELGDALVVGVDSDAKVRARGKGPHRPIVSEAERAAMLCALEAVDLVYIKQLEDARWELIKVIRPDVLVISERSGYSDEEVKELQKLCGSVVVLESQAEVSTTARIRTLIISSVAPLLGEFETLQTHMEAFRIKLLEIMGVAK